MAAPRRSLASEGHTAACTAGRHRRHAAASGQRVKILKKHGRPKCSIYQNVGATYVTLLYLALQMIPAETASLLTDDNNRRFEKFGNSGLHGQFFSDIYFWCIRSRHESSACWVRSPDCLIVRFPAASSAAPCIFSTAVFDGSYWYCLSAVHVAICKSQG